MIQILTYSGKTDEFKGNDVVINSIHDAQSLDEFDINIINLNDENMWLYKGNNNNSINTIKDFVSLSSMINYCNKTKILILQPQNIMYKYFYFSGKYNEFCELKNMTKALKDIIMVLSPFLNNMLVYENTNTIICGAKVKASFYFNVPEEKVLLKSEKSQKPTAIIVNDNMITSTLYIKNYDEIMCLLKELKLLQNKQSIPSWIEEIKMFDDIRQFEIIEQNNQVIRQANDAITVAMESINKNNRYKSILYTNGEELVDVVFEILTEMLGCDLSEFEDKKKEDFLFNIDGHVFIGEIKGVNHNVKNENISQLEVHYQSYIDNNPDIEVGNISAILIINYQRNKPIPDREPVHENQIALAKRNGSLIIQTMTLLKLFEKYVGREMTREQCLDILKSNIGLLKIEEK